METEYEEGVFPLRAKGSIVRPDRGSAKLDRKESRAAIERTEEKHKATAKKRDGGKCRLPFCPWCAAFKDQLLHGAHVIEAKGMGGDPTLEVSTPDYLMALCALSHKAQENHDWAVDPLTDALCNGPCEFYLVQDVYHPETGRFSTLRVLWARETAIGVVDLPHPRVRGWQPIHSSKVQD